MINNDFERERCDGCLFFSVCETKDIENDVGLGGVCCYNKMKNDSGLYEMNEWTEFFMSRDLNKKTKRFDESNYELSDWEQYQMEGI